MAPSLVATISKHGTTMVFAAVFALVYLVFGGIAVVSWWPDAHVAYTGTHTQGRVTAKEPANHQNILYAFSIGSQQFTGVQMADLAAIPFDAVTVGDPISVTYDPRDPTKSLPGDTSVFLRSCYSELLVWLPLFCILPAALAAYRVRHPNFLSMRRAAI
jgi:hypothetical protein